MLVKKFLRLIFSFETAFVLFLFSGRFKADPRFAWIPVDITLLFLLISGLAGIYILNKNQFIVNKKAARIVMLYSCFAFFTLLSLFWSPSTGYGVTKAVHVFTLVFWSITGSAFIIAQSRERMKRFFTAIFLFAAWVTVESLLFYLANSGAGFINVLGGNYLGIGRTIGYGIILLIGYLLYYVKNKFTMLIAACGLFLAFFTLLNVGGRGPLISVVAAFFIPLLYSFGIKKKTLVVTKTFITASIIFFLLFAYTVYILAADKVPPTIKRILLLFDDNSKGASADTRLGFYERTVSIWGESPFFGNGIGSWPIMMGQPDGRGYPHNIFLEIASELGAVGLLLFIVSMALPLMYILKYLKREPFSVFIMMFFINTLISAMISGDLSDNRFLFCLLGLMAFTPVKENSILEPAVHRLQAESLPGRNYQYKRGIL